MNRFYFFLTELVLYNERGAWEYEETVHRHKSS